MTKSHPKIYKILSILLCLLLCFEQTGFAQVAAQLDIAGHLGALHNALTVDRFRPLHLRYLQYLPKQNSFRLLLDKGDQQQTSLRGAAAGGDEAISNETKTLLKYFFIGLSLPNDSFWVNLRPDSPDSIIDPLLAQTDIGKILLAADVQLKKDTASFTSPNTPEGREYWDKLYQKAGELFGNQNITIPTLTRPWIVPDEIIIRETVGEANSPEHSEGPSAYIYKATLKVMLEEDYLKSAVIASPEGAKQSLNSIYNFKDDRLKELNVYSSQLIRELIIPKLTKEINTSKRYAQLRQVYYSLILASWFKARQPSLPTASQTSPQSLRATEGSKAITNLIDSRNLTNLTSKEPWSKDTYFNAYQKSFKDGEYNFQEPAYTPYGQVVRSYFSGGIAGLAITTMPRAGELTLIDRETGARVTVLEAIGRISSAENPYLLAADVLEANPDSKTRTTVMENLVVRLSDAPISQEQIQQRVNEIDDAHFNVAPDRHVGPRNPDGTYSRGTFEAKDIFQKARRMPSFTTDQRRDVMKYALAGQKASPENKIPSDLLKRMWRAFDNETPVIYDSNGPMYIDIKYPTNGVHLNLTVGYDKPGVRIFDDFDKSSEMDLVVTSPNLSKYQAKIPDKDEQRLINHVMQVLEAARDNHPKIEEFLQNLSRDRAVVQQMATLKKKYVRAVITDSGQREKVRSELDRLLDIPFDEINTEQMDYIQGLLASLGYEPMYVGDKTPYDETLDIIRDAGTADAKQGDVAYIQYLEDSGDLYEKVATEYVGYIKRLNESGRIIIIMSDGQEVNLNFVRKILVGENGEGGHYDTAKDEWGPWDFLKDVDIRLPVKITTVTNEIKKTAWKRIKGEKITVLEAPSVQNGGVMTYVNAEGEVDARYEEYIKRIYLIGFNSEIAQLSSHLFKEGDRVIVDLDNKTYEGTVVAFAGEPQSQFTASPMMQVKIDNPPDPTHPYLRVSLNSEGARMIAGMEEGIKNVFISLALERLYQIFFISADHSEESVSFREDLKTTYDKIFGSEGLCESNDFGPEALDVIFKDATGLTFQEILQQTSTEGAATNSWLPVSELEEPELQEVKQLCAQIQFGFALLNRKTNTTPPVIRIDDLWNTVLQDPSGSDLTLGALLRRFSKKPYDYQYRLVLARKMANRKEMFVLLGVLDDLEEHKANIIGLGNSALQIVFEEKTKDLENPDDKEVIKFVLGLDSDQKSNARQLRSFNVVREELKQKATVALTGVVPGSDLDALVENLLDAIVQAHLVGQGKRGVYTDLEIAEKARILERRMDELGLNKDKKGRELARNIRRALMEAGVAGFEERFKKAPNESVVAAAQAGPGGTSEAGEENGATVRPQAKGEDIKGNGPQQIVELIKRIQLRKPQLISQVKSGTNILMKFDTGTCYLTQLLKVPVSEDGRKEFYSTGKWPKGLRAAAIDNKGKCRLLDDPLILGTQETALAVTYIDSCWVLYPDEAEQVLQFLPKPGDNSVLSLSREEVSIYVALEGILHEQWGVDEFGRLQKEAAYRYDNTMPEYLAEVIQADAKNFERIREKATAENYRKAVDILISKFGKEAFIKAAEFIFREHLSNLDVSGGVHNDVHKGYGPHTDINGSDERPLGQEYMSYAETVINNVHSLPDTMQYYDQVNVRTLPGDVIFWVHLRNIYPDIFNTLANYLLGLSDKFTPYPIEKHMSIDEIMKTFFPEAYKIIITTHSGQSNLLHGLGRSGNAQDSLRQKAEAGLGGQSSSSAPISTTAPEGTPARGDNAQPEEPAAAEQVRPGEAVKRLADKCVLSGRENYLHATNGAVLREILRSGGKVLPPAKAKEQGRKIYTGEVKRSNFGLGAKVVFTKALSREDISVIEQYAAYSSAEEAISGGDRLRIAPDSIDKVMAFVKDGITRYIGTSQAYKDRYQELLELKEYFDSLSEQERQEINALSRIPVILVGYNSGEDIDTNGEFVPADEDLVSELKVTIIAVPGIYSEKISELLRTCNEQHNIVVISSDEIKPLHRLYNQIKQNYTASREDSPSGGGVAGSSGIDPSARSGSTPPASGAAGGIDFRSLPIVTQAIGNLRMNMDIHAINRLRSSDVSRELQDIQREVDAGITPSGERVKEYVQASSIQGNLDIEKVVSCISDILRHEEETCSQTEPALRDILVVLESSRNNQELSEVFVGKI